MPYIPKERRGIYPDFLDGLPHNSGELNFIITSICLAYLDQNDVINYQIYNDIIGALESAKLEFYRRLVSGYEDVKIKENGDVY